MCSQMLACGRSFGGGGDIIFGTIRTRDFHLSFLDVVCLSIVVFFPTTFSNTFVRIII
jgi:hypothetical protein